jgi:hypothetical protein
MAIRNIIERDIIKVVNFSWRLLPYKGSQFFKSSWRQCLFHKVKLQQASITKEDDLHLNPHPFSQFDPASSAITPAEMQQHEAILNWPPNSKIFLTLYETYLQSKQ